LSPAKIRSDVRKRHEKAHTCGNGNTSLAGDETSSVPLLSVISPSSIGAQQQQDGSGSHNAETFVHEATSGSTLDWLEPLESAVSMDEFDFGSLDTFLNDVMIDWVQGTNNSQYYYAGLVPPTAQHSRARTPNTDTEGAGPQTQFIVDQQYSNDISRQLKPVQPHYETTYSAEYLNLCLRMYFAHFQPVFPVVHEATFRPRSSNILLLISMCSIGSLFIGSPEAIVQGHQLYARLNKAILASWETHISEPKQSTIPIAQAALLGQTFGLLSGKSADRFMTEVFHGTMLAWGRKIDAFNLTEETPLNARLTGPELASVWKSWAKAEERRRFNLALYIHDTETAGLFQRDPLLRHQRINYSICSGDDLFNASTSEEWQRLYFNQTHGTTSTESVKVGQWAERGIGDPGDDPLSISIRRSSFIAYSSLANVGACAMDLSSPGRTPVNGLEANAQGLSKWHKIYLCDARDGSMDVQCLRVLYHQYSLLLYADFMLLERALSDRRTQADIEWIQAWATSSMAPPAMLHACLLQKHASDVKLGTVPPIHLPRAIFCAGVVFIAIYRYFPTPIGKTYISRWKADTLNMHHAASIALGERQQIEQMASWVCETLNSRLSTMPYACINLLRKLGQWGVSEVFADTLQALLGHSPVPSNSATLGSPTT
jgi:hypothetical protein